MCVLRFEEADFSDLKYRWKKENKNEEEKSPTDIPRWLAFSSIPLYPPIFWFSARLAGAFKVD